MTKRGRKELPYRTNRRCCKCGLIKSIEEFHRSNTLKDKTKRMYSCKRCNTFYTRKTHWQRELIKNGIKAFIEKTHQYKELYELREKFILNNTDTEEK